MELLPPPDERPRLAGSAAPMSPRLGVGWPAGVAAYGWYEGPRAPYVYEEADGYTAATVEGPGASSAPREGAPTDGPPAALNSCVRP